MTPGEDPLYRATKRYGQHCAEFVDHYLAQWKPYKPFWNYEDGCIYKGALDLADATGAERLHEFVYRKVSERVAQNGRLQGFDPDEFNIDSINAGKVLFPLHERHREERFLGGIEQQYAQLVRHPRTRSGNFWHKKIYPHQVWLDGLYMAQPFLCAYAQLHQRPEILEDVFRQFAHVQVAMRDARTGLYYHGWDESRAERWANPETGCSPCFWGRAMGWFVMALADCIALTDSSLAGHALLRQMLAGSAHALMQVRSSGGLWWQVLDRGGDPGNYEEASATLMIAYAFMKAARLGALPSDYGDAGLASFEACVARYLSPTELRGICAVAGLGNQPYRDGSYEYYLSEPVVANDPKGVGAFMMALAEACRR